MEFGSMEELRKRQAMQSLEQPFSHLLDEDRKAQAPAALALVFSAGVEMFGGPALLWFYTAACSLVLLIAIADQQRRLY